MSQISRRQLLAASALAALRVDAHGQTANWPNRPIRLIAGGVGGVTDIRARWLAERLGNALGQPVIVENNAAAGGNVAAEQVAKAPADGHTLLLTHQGIAAVNPHLYPQTRFDVLGDFMPITRFGYGSLLLTVPARSPVNSAQELIAHVKANSGTMNYGTPGVGTPPHLASELFKRMAGIDAVHVPYRGGGALMAAILGGQLTWTIEGLTSQLPHVRAGNLKALAVTGRQRSNSLPQVPSFSEAALPGYEFSGWTGIAAPAATPRTVVNRLNAEILKIANTDEARKWFESGGAEAGVNSPEEFAQFVRAEHEKLGKLIREAGIKAE
jgi:tripartite-type tricarboxylate transporter receptor subunit TctC